MAFPSIKASAKGGGKDFELIPAGVHFAICTQVVHVGKQAAYNPKYPDKDEVWLQFEIPDHTVEWEKNGKHMSGPGIIRRKFTLSLADKSLLRPFLESWRGKAFTAEEEEGFEITALVGKVCQLSVIHEASKDGKKMYANINGAFQLIKEQKESLQTNPGRGKPQGPLVVYTPEAHDQTVYESLPEWQRKLIDGRIKSERTPGADDDKVSTAKDDFDDDIPF